MNVRAQCALDQVRLTQVSCCRTPQLLMVRHCAWQEVYKVLRQECARNRAGRRFCKEDQFLESDSRGKSAHSNTFVGGSVKIVLVYVQLTHTMLAQSEILRWSGESASLWSCCQSAAGKLPPVNIRTLELITRASRSLVWIAKRTPIKGAPLSAICRTDADSPDVCPGKLWTVGVAWVLQSDTQTISQFAMLNIVRYEMRRLSERQRRRQRLAPSDNLPCENAY
jgi:hypothetical protein